MIRHGEVHWLEQETVVGVAGGSFDIAEEVVHVTATGEAEEVLGTVAVVLVLGLGLAS